ncbi:hypothetical protein [Fuerstiella marisgermanici]|uniref:hypothetical protein n=1 Tax=Fuerstiella marisgermanici TaxID=1891926 RepID=UPI0011AB5595|nr:hypothetical protein [Fuerstiella marisgermanici]
MTNQEFLEARERCTRLVACPDGMLRTATLPPTFWEAIHWLEAAEGITQKEVAGYAMEEISLQDDMTCFSEALRCVVLFLTKPWGDC